MARAGKLGILIKSGVALEKMARVDAIVFDKTGTLTSGNPHVTRVESVGRFTEDELLAMAAAVENRLSHPAAQAIVAAAVKKKLEIPHRSGASHSIGLGVAAKVGDHEVSLGSRTMMTKRKVDLAVSFEWEKSASEQGQSLVYVARRRTGWLHRLYGHYPQRGSQRHPPSAQTRSAQTCYGHW